MMRMRSRQSQAGASIFTTLIIVALIGLVLLAGLKIAPAYLDHTAIVNALEGALANQEAGTGIADLRSSVARTANVNGIRDFDASAIDLVRESGQEYVVLSYEKRVPLFYNIDAVVSFEDRFAR